MSYNETPTKGMQMLYLAASILVIIAYLIGSARARSLGHRSRCKQLQIHKKELQRIHQISYQDGYTDGIKKERDDQVMDTVLKLMYNPKV